MANLKAALSNTSFLKKLRKALGLGDELTAVKTKPVEYDAVSCSLDSKTLTVTFETNVEEAFFSFNKSCTTNDNSYSYYFPPQIFSSKIGLFYIRAVSNQHYHAPVRCAVDVDDNVLTITYFPGTYSFSPSVSDYSITAYVYE
jgi:hypothetical protein